MPNKWEIIIWNFYQAINWEYWFIEIPWEKDNIFVFWENKWSALDQDQVEAKIQVFKWRFEAIITKVIKRAERIIIGEFQKARKWNFGFVKPLNQAFKKDIFIPLKNNTNIKDKYIIAVKIKKWSWKNPEWKIIKILWDKNHPENIINWYILEAWFKLDFPNNVKKEMENLEKPTKFDKKRKNKKNLFTFTIDWENAKDLDDAISIEKQNWNYVLFVHIADVASYVKAWTATEKEALSRWTSVYMPHKVLPMFPQELSNNLCSLNPNQEKLTLTCEIHINKDWSIKEYNVYESIIESNFRLTYEEVEKIHENEIKKGDKTKFFEWKINEELIEKINLAYELSDKITKIKEKQWLLVFNFSENNIVLDENLNVLKFEKYRLYSSNKIIEEFMVLANEFVSRKFHKYPFLYRIHEKPKLEDREKLEKLLKIFWVNFNFKKYDTKEYWDLIKAIENHEAKYILEKIILRTLQKAEYSNVNMWHFWLWLDYYSHFTSPIRRYPDYSIHRIIKEQKQWKLTNNKIIKYKDNLEKISKKCTEQEIKAQKLEWKIRDFFMVRYYKDKIWEIFQWTVSWMIKTWVFIELQNWTEWFVELVSKEKKDRVQDLEILEFKNQKNWKKIRIWDKVKIKVISTDESLLRMNFEIIDS